MSVRRVTFRFVVEGDSVTEAIVNTDRASIRIPTRGIPISKRNDVERLLRELIGMGVELDRAKVEPVSGEVAREEGVIIELVNKLKQQHFSPKLFQILDGDRWTPKSEIDRALGTSGKQLAGVLANITIWANKLGLSKPIEKRWNSIRKELEYKLTDIGVKVKEKLQSISRE